MDVSEAETLANRQKLAFRQVLQAAQLMGGRIGIFLKGWQEATVSIGEDLNFSGKR